MSEIKVETTDESVSLGSLEKIRMDLTKPMVWKQETMEFRKLTLFTGLNGAGKSLVLKLNWVLSTIMTTAVVLHSNNMPFNGIKEVTQEVMNGTFLDQDFNGSIGADFTNGLIDIKLEDGKVVDVLYNIDKKVKTAPAPVFLSSDTRTFEQIDPIIKASIVLPQETYFKTYRLYDIVFVERLKRNLKGGFKTPPEFKENMKSMGMEKYDFDTFDIEDDRVIFIDKIGKKTKMATLSKGEQSIVNMALANWYTE